MAFKEDLAKWMAFEEEVINMLNKEGKMNVIKNPCEKCMDLIIIEKGIEVKKDFGAEKTWNAYIEYESYWQPSGIFKDELISLSYWVHSICPNSFHIMDWKRFRRWVAEKIEECKSNKSLTSKGFRLVSWWDWKRTKWLLVPIKYLDEQAIKKYYLE